MVTLCIHFLEQTISDIYLIMLLRLFVNDYNYYGICGYSIDQDILSKLLRRVIEKLSKCIIL